MPRQPNITQAKTKFLVELQKARSMYDAFEGLPRRINPRAASGIHPKHLHKARELAFLGVVGAWEEFLEQSLVRYAMGVETINGYRPVLIAQPCRTVMDAYRLVSGEPLYHPSRDYLKRMNNPSSVANIARRLFSTHPFGCIGAYSGLLNNATILRNRIAHKSTKSRHAFVGTAKWFLQSQANPMPLSQSFSPGALLGKHVQRHFAAPLVSAGTTHFEAYLRLYGDLSNTIVP